MGRPDPALRRVPDYGFHKSMSVRDTENPPPESDVQVTPPSAISQRKPPTVRLAPSRRISPSPSSESLAHVGRAPAASRRSPLPQSSTQSSGGGPGDHAGSTTSHCAPAASIEHATVSVGSRKRDGFERSWSAAASCCVPPQASKAVSENRAMATMGARRGRCERLVWEEITRSHFLELRGRTAAATGELGRGMSLQAYGDPVGAVSGSDRCGGRCRAPSGWAPTATRWW